MFSVEIKVNGFMIGHIYGRNTGLLPNGETSYIYEYYKPESREVQQGDVSYKRENGIEKLICKILTDSQEKEEE